ncbi:MAG: caspase family protein [Cyclobacteriaceae bacterium]
MSLCFAEAQSFTSVIQKGHGEDVKSARYIRNGEFLISVSRDKTARLWNAETGMEMRSFIGHEHTINGFSVSGNKLATSSADGTVIIWDLVSGDMLWRSRMISGYVTDVAFNNSGSMIAIGSYEDSVSIYRTSDYSILKKIRANPDKGVGYGVSVAFSPDDKYLSIGQDNRTAKVYGAEDWNEVHELKPEAGYCGGCGTLSTFDPSSSSLLKLSNGAAFSRYDLTTGELMWESAGKLRDVSSVDFSENGDYFLAATEDTVFVYSGKTGQLFSKWSQSGKINDASFHPSEEQILIALDKVSVLTDIQGEEIKVYQGILNQTSTGLDYDLGSYWEHYIAKWVKYKSAQLLDGNFLYMGKTASKARKWNVNTASIAMEYIGHEKGILCFERITDDLIATGGGDGKIIIWNEKTGKIEKEIKGHREPVFDLAISNDGQLLASCGWDGVISTWNTETWERHNYIYNEGRSAYNIAFTENDAYLVVGLLDKTLQLWEIETKRFVKEFVGHTDVVTSIQVEGNEILSAGWDGRAILWDLFSGLIKRKISTEQPCFSALLSEEHILTAGADREISFWNRKNGEKEAVLQGHQAEINGLQVSGNLMISSDIDGVTKFWSLAGRKELFEHIQIGKNDWMIKTSDGYFDATDQAVSNIHFVRGMEVFSSSQFMHEFYKPGLARSLFSDTRTGKTSMERELESSPPPIVKLSGLAGNDNVADLFLKVETRGGGAEDIKLFHNGRRVNFQDHIIKTRNADQHTTVYSIKFPMVAGINEFSASASSKANVESAKTSFSLVSTSKTPGSRCHILAVGINEYLNESLNLNYAKPDASSFALQMKEQSEAIYSEVVLHQIFDKEATKQGILNKLNEIKDQIAANDVFIFYYAGHGSMVDDKFYLVSAGASRLYDNQKMSEYGIEAEALKQAMLEVKALKQLIIMDACQSGGSVETLAQRGAPEEKAIAQLSRSSGIHVMASAGSDQYATEFESLGHGLFTYLLLKGLSGEADGAPKDGKVTIYELKSYLDDQVPELSIKYKGTPQYPHTFSRGQDFPIVIVK